VFLSPLGVRKLPGIGPVSEEKLLQVGIRTLGELADARDVLLRPIFGTYTVGLRADARGLGDAELGRERPAFREHDPRGSPIGSISNERTFAETSPAVTERVLSGLCERVAWRARSRGVRAGRVTLRLRYADFRTITRAQTIKPTNADVDVHRVALTIYRRERAPCVPIRLIGVALSKLSLEDVQLDLPRVDGGAVRGRAVDAVREKFGYDAVHIATTLRH
jgi:DNA polymerase-4